MKVGSDILSEHVLVKDGRHAVGLVTLALVSAGLALPLIEHLVLGLGPGGGRVLEHGPDLDNITQIL